MGDTTDIPESECPTCHYRVDRTTGAYVSGAPSKGDISLCFKCGTACVFDEKLRLAEMSADDLRRLKKEHPDSYAQLRRAQRSAGMSDKGRESIKHDAIKNYRDFQKKADARKDDLIILKSKIVLLKRLLLTQSSVKAANDILNKK